MPTTPPIGPKDYYDLLPPSTLTPGDVWSDLPTVGLLRWPRTPGVVITPACDLANRKVETLTYLPVIPVLQYFGTPAFFPEIFRETAGQLRSAGAENLLDTDSHRYSPPNFSAVEGLRAILATKLKQPRLPAREYDAFQRADAGLRIFAAITQSRQPATGDLALLFGNRHFHSTLEKIVRNAYRLDIHFLPADEQLLEWSGVAAHSVVLFRYPITAPVQLFEAANDQTLKDWSAAVSDISSFWPVAGHFAETRPLKRLSIKPRFLSDLLTRYVAMYVRLGSPDFTPETIGSYVEQLEQN